MMLVIAIIQFSYLIVRLMKELFNYLIISIKSRFIMFLQQCSYNL